MPGGLGALLGQMEVFLQSGNHLGGVVPDISVLPVRRFAFEDENRLPIGRNLASGELAVEAVALQVGQLFYGPVFGGVNSLRNRNPALAASSVRCW